MSRRVHSAEGRALAVGDQHEAGRVDAVRTVRRAPVVRTRLPALAAAEGWSEWELAQALAHEAYTRSAQGVIERARSVTLACSVLYGRLARGEGAPAEHELRAAEDEVLRAIAARRRVA